MLHFDSFFWVCCTLVFTPPPSSLQISTHHQQCTYHTETWDTQIILLPSLCVMPTHTPHTYRDTQIILLPSFSVMCAHTHTHTLSLLNTHILHALIHYSFSCLDTQVLKQVYLPLIKVKQSQYMSHIKLYKTNNADILYKVTLFCSTCIRQDVINTQHQEQKGLRSTLSNGYLL